MKLLIDTDKKTIEVPKEFKDAFDNQTKIDKMLGKGTQTLSTMIDLSEFKVVAKQTRVIKDKTNAKSIDAYMESVKDTDKDKYKEYIALRDRDNGLSKTGKKLKTNFLTIKKWFYQNYPSQNPYKKEQ